MEERDSDDEFFDAVASWIAPPPTGGSAHSSTAHMAGAASGPLLAAAPSADLAAELAAADLAAASGGTAHAGLARQGSVAALPPRAATAAGQAEPLVWLSYTSWSASAEQ